MAKLTNHADRPGRLQFRFSGLVKDKHHRPTGDIICEISLLAAEILTIIAAGLGALFGSWPFPAVDIEPGLSSMSDARLWAVAPELSIVAGLAWAHMIFHGHYTRPVPFKTEFRGIVELSLFAVLATGCMELATRSNFSGHLLAVIWFLFMATLVVTRRTTRHLLALAGLWQIEVLVICDCGMKDVS